MPPLFSEPQFGYSRLSSVCKLSRKKNEYRYLSAYGHKLSEVPGTTSRKVDHIILRLKLRGNAQFLDFLVPIESILYCPRRLFKDGPCSFPRWLCFFFRGLTYGPRCGGVGSLLYFRRIHLAQGVVQIRQNVRQKNKTRGKKKKK